MFNLKKFLAACIVASAVFGFGSPARSEVVVDFYRVYMPNYYGSANYDSMWNNGKYALINGLDSYDGFGGGKGAFTGVDVTVVTGVQSYVTNYESWNGEYMAGEYGGRPSWFYHVYDSEGAMLDYTATIFGREYFDDYGEARHSTSGWGVLGVTYHERKFVGYDASGNLITTLAGSYDGENNSLVKGFVGVSGNSWWHKEDGAIIEDDSSPYWDDRFDLLAAHGDDVEKYQTLWGFELTYDGQAYTAQDIKIVPEPATIGLLVFALGGVALMRRKRG